ncbi:type II toxin-antitoxin system RelE/ParE family toxin [Chondromyces crocatus]|uniref:Plasmid stabilization protein n=1 Tax=Chondromyces crocatus TaxID=52 RepID=A0A0K1EPI9_CHOCO|nr:uncharacterized protein CMC5_069980 [Chondromyces crocatus]
MELRVHKDAEEDLIEAGLFYKRQRQSLDEEFLAEVDAVQRIITENPRAYPVVERHKNVHRMKIGKFSYWVYYVVHEKEILVLAYAHERLKPGYWKPRLKS